MWEALMLLRLIASASPRYLPRDNHAAPPQVPSSPALKGAIRLSFAAFRLSLPLSQRTNGHGHHDRKIA
jgi:hypothetical protein